MGVWNDVDDLTEADVEYLREAGILKVRRMPDGSLAGLHLYLTSVGLISEIKLGAMANYYHHRYCYPRSELLLAHKALAEWDGVGKPLPGYVAYKGGDEKLYMADEERKFNCIKMEDQNIV